MIARRAVTAVLAICLAGTPGRAADLPAPVISTLQEAADTDSASLTRAARRSIESFPRLTREIRLEVLALSLENAVAADPAGFDSLVASAVGAAAKRGLFASSADRRLLRLRAEAARKRAGVQARPGMAGSGQAAVEISRDQQVALDAVTEAAISEMRRTPSRAADIAQEAIRIAAERGLPVTAHFRDRLQRRAAFLQRQPRAPSPSVTAERERAEEADSDGQDEADEPARGWPTESEDRKIGGLSLTSGWLPFALGGGLLGAGAGIALAVDGSGGGDTVRASDFLTEEVEGSGFLSRIAAPDAYARGAFGQNRIIAVSSAGVDIEHPELAGQIAAGGADLVDGDADPNPVGSGVARSVGTAVASIAAGRSGGPAAAELPNPPEDGAIPQTQGVAPQAQILPIRRLTSAGTPMGALADAIDIAVDGGAAVFNDTAVSVQPFNTISEEGGNGPFVVAEFTNAERAAFLRGAAADMIFVYSTGGGTGGGNDDGIDGGTDGGAAALEASPEALAPQEFPAIEPFFLAARGEGLNPCGGAAEWCLTAPSAGLVAAVDVNDTADLDADGYATIDGPAAPAATVAGAVAVLQSMFPQLPASDIRTILLQTADDIEAPGVDPVAGHGFLNLERATRPLGETEIQLSETLGVATTPLAESAMTLSAAFGTASIAGLEAAHIGFLDAFDRSYAVPASALVQRAPSITRIDAVADSFGRRTRRLQGGPVKDGSAFSLAIRQTGLRHRGPRSGASDRARQTATDRTAWLASARLPGITLGAGGGALGLSESFGLGGQGVTASDLDPGTAAHANPYLRLIDAPQAYSLALPRGRAQLRMGMASGRGNGDSGLVGELVFADAPASPGDQAARGSRLVLQAGVLREGAGLLGAEFGGAFALDRGTATHFAGGAAALPLGDKTMVIGNAFIGRTAAAPGAQSLFRDLGPLWSASGAIGVIRRGLLNDTDRLRFSVARPLRLIAGKAMLRLPQNRIGARIVSEDRQIGLAAADRPLDFEAAYRWTGFDGVTLSAGAVLHTRLGDTAGTPLGGSGILRLRTGF